MKCGQRPSRLVKAGRASLDTQNFHGALLDANAVRIDKTGAPCRSGIFGRNQILSIPAPPTFDPLISLLNFERSPHLFWTD
jgi:hypothetical protein